MILVSALVTGEFGGNKKMAVIENLKQSFEIYLDSGNSYDDESELPEEAGLNFEE